MRPWTNEPWWAPTRCTRWRRAASATTSATSALDDYGTSCAATPGIFITDGSAVPCALTVNPALTISALAERAVPGIVKAAQERGVPTSRYGAPRSGRCQERRPRGYPPPAQSGYAMKNAMMANGLRRSLAQIRYVSPVMPGTADGLAASVYAQAESDFGMVAPPLALHSPAPPLLAAAWVMLRETLLVTGQADRAEKEVVAAAVSVANACPYCVAVHSAAAHDQIPGLDAAGITSNLASPLLKEIAGWARSSGLRGLAESSPPANFAELAGWPSPSTPEPDGDDIPPESPLPPMTPKAIGGWVMSMLRRP